MPPIQSINIHPQDHLASSLTTDIFDVICIGSGWAGRVTAARVAKAGLTAVIVEDELVGGDCPFWACVPTKALVRPEVTLRNAKAVNGVKQLLNASQVLDATAVFARRDMYTSGFDDSKVLIPMVESSGTQIIRGLGTLAGEKRVLVHTQDGQEVMLEAKHAVVLATGSEPTTPNIPGLADIDPWYPRQATSSSEVPQHLIILGAGAVGCELAVIYASLGSKVSLICPQDEILPKLDTEAGQIVRESMQRSGLEVLTSTRAVSVSKVGDMTQVVLSNGKTIEGSKILVAVGRKAKTSGIGLESFGITALTVDESLCVEAVPGSWLYAVGDINRRASLTHFSKYEGRIAANAIIARAKGQAISRQPYSPTAATAEHHAIVQVVFTIPEVASVGHTKQSATAARLKYCSVSAPMFTLGAAIHTEGYEQGWAQWIVDDNTNRLLGATFCGEDCAELIHASTVAIVGGLTLEQLSHAVPSFPTMSEVYLNLLEASGI